MPEFHGKYKSVTKGLMDQFFFGNDNVMKIVMNTFSDIDLNASECHSTEGLLYDQIERNGIVIKRFLCTYGTLDKNGKYISVFA
jgi:hypothetical protein